MKKAVSKLTLSKETLRALESADLAEARGGITNGGDVSCACSKPKTCNTMNTCTSQFC